jgi:hypothetical protein
MEWVLAAVLAFFEPSAPTAARVVVIEMGHIAALADAAQRTQMMVFEETFCLVGVARPNGVYHILGVVRPRQLASIRQVRAGIMSMVVSEPCPPGTIGDLHTHPFGSPRPSYVDRANWERNRRFTLHLVGFMLAPDKAGFQAYDYTDPADPVKLRDQWLVVTQRKEGTWRR